MTSKDKTVDAKALMASIAKGYKLVPTPKVRAGMKKGQQQLVTSNDKTLGMLTLREGKGVRVEGNRLAKNVTVTSVSEVAEARKLLEVVSKENIIKLNDATAKQRVANAKAAQAKASKPSDLAPSGKRARSRNSRAQVVA